jgi:predicted amidophosphoribosyltransferase
MEQKPRTCQQCGRPLQEDDDKYCEDCLVTMSAGGSAHYMAEKIREKRKQDQEEKK